MDRRDLSVVSSILRTPVHVEEVFVLHAAEDLVDPGRGELPDVIPDWVLELGPVPEPLGCDCGCPGADGAPADAPRESQVDTPWATPGVTGLAPFSPGLPPVSREVAGAQAAIGALVDADATGLPVDQALADGEALLALEQQMRVLNLRRLADVGARGLHDLVGFRSTKAWLRHHRPDGDAGDAALAAQLRDFGVVRGAVDAGSVPLAGARKVLLALRRARPHVDRPGGLVGGQPGHDVLVAAVGHVLALVCRSLQGLHGDDPRLAGLQERARLCLRAGTQLEVLEAALTWLAEHLPSRHLAGPLDEVLVALLPSELDDRDDRGHERRGLSLTPRDDGSGWHVCGDLDNECGERLWVALGAEARRDPDNPADTATWSEAGDQDVDLWSLGAALAGSERPRGRRQRLHDALSRLLGRYLDTGLGGTSGKVPVQVSVTLTEATVTGQPGAPPPRTDSGRLVPVRLVRRWWCDARVTAFVLGAGGKALRVVHGGRTLTGVERRALAVEGGDRCVGDGCCSGLPDPLVPLRPHHVLGHATHGRTSLEETLPVCDVLHRDVHEGGRTVRLRDGRYLGERGLRDAPSLADLPPF
ncbi:MAG: DUF222 domain-containing protein [Mycobacteriales bacterium]